MHGKSPSAICVQCRPDQRRLIRALIVRLQNLLIPWYMSTNGECSDQTAGMRMVIWTYVVRKLYKGFFVRCASNGIFVSVNCMHVYNQSTESANEADA